MKEVLLISNLDLQSPDVLRYVAEFCMHYQCKLHIIHFDESVDPVLLSSSQTYYNLDQQITNLELRNDLINKIKSETFKYIDSSWVNLTIKGDNETWFLDKFVTENNLDLIFIGQNIFIKHQDRIGDIIKDTITGHTMTPILVLPTLQVFKSIESINYLLKTLDDKNLNNLTTLSKLYPLANIKLTHIIENQTDELDKIHSQKWMTYLNKYVNEKITLESESIGYNQYIQQENYAIIRLSDLLVFSTYNRNFWGRIIDPSSTLRQLSTLQIPSLIFKHIKAKT